MLRLVASIWQGGLPAVITSRSAILAWSEKRKVPALARKERRLLSGFTIGRHAYLSVATLAFGETTTRICNHFLLPAGARGFGRRFRQIHFVDLSMQRPSANSKLFGRC